jgi:hypothetical protein
MSGSRVLEFKIVALNLVRRGVMAARQELEGLKRVAGGLQSIGRGIGTAWGVVERTFLKVAGVVGVAAAALGYSIKKAFEFEAYEVQFKVLLGSMDKAKARMKELAEFSAATPFELPQIVAASRQLHVLTGGLMGGAASLRLVGDAASAAGADIGEVAMWVGRAYSMIKAGRPFGEAAMRLQEMGILGAGARNEMEALQAQGSTSARVWSVLAKTLGEFSGGMVEASRTGEGLLSSLKDNAAIAIATFGKAFQEDAKDAIQSLMDWLAKLSSDGTIEAWAQKAREALQIAAEIGKALTTGTGRKEVWEGLQDVLVGAFRIAASKAVELLIAASAKIGSMIGDAAKDAFEFMPDLKENAAYKADIAEGYRSRGIDPAKTRGRTPEDIVQEAQGKAKARRRAKLMAEGATEAEAYRKTNGQSGSEQFQAGMDRIIGVGKAGVAANAMTPIEQDVAAFERDRRARVESKASKTAGVDLAAKTSADLAAAETKRLNEAKFNLQAMVKGDQDAAAAMIAGRKEVQKAFEVARDAEVVRLEYEADLIKKAGSAKTQEYKDAQKKIQDAKGKTLDWSVSKPWIDLLKKTAEGIDGVKSERLDKQKRIDEKRLSLIDRKRESTIAGMTDPKDQAKARRAYISELEGQKRAEKDAEKRLDIEEKIMAEQEKIAGLTKKSADAWKSASLGDIFGSGKGGGRSNRLVGAVEGNFREGFRPLAKSAFSPLGGPVGSGSKSWANRQVIGEGAAAYASRMAGAGGLTAKKSPEEETAKNTKDILLTLQKKPIGGMKP